MEAALAAAPDFEVVEAGHGQLFEKAAAKTLHERHDRLDPCLRVGQDHDPPAAGGDAPVGRLESARVRHGRNRRVRCSRVGMGASGTGA